MIGIIIKKEILDNLLSHKFLFIFILCSVLILFSIYIGAADYVESKKEYDANVAALNARMQPPTTYAFFSERLGYRVYRPPQILRTIVAGIEDAAGRASYPNLQYENNLAESKHENNTIFTLFGSLDLMFAIKFILSLCAIFLAYDTVSGEKEKSTLKLMLSNSVSRHQLISGKIIGNYLSILLFFLVPLLMGLILLLLFPGISFTGGDWLRLLFIFIMFLLYVSVFFALGIFISTVTVRSSTSFLILLFIWLALVTVIPGASVVVAEHLRPAPSSSMLASQKGLAGYQIQQDINEESSKKRSEFSQRDKELTMKGLELQRLSKESPHRYQEELEKIQEEFAKLNEESMKITAGFQQELDDRVAANNAKVNRDYQLKKDAQRNFAKNLSRISPATALTFGSMTLARTGTDEYDRFVAATRAYRPIYRSFRTRVSTDSDFRDPQTGYKQIDVNIIPQFPFVPESLGESLARTLPDFALMAAMTILLLTGAFFAFLRYDVR